VWCRLCGTTINAVRSDIRQHVSGKRHCLRLATPPIADAKAKPTHIKDPLEVLPTDERLRTQWFVEVFRSCGGSPALLDRLTARPWLLHLMSSLPKKHISSSAACRMIRESDLSKDLALQKLMELSTVVHLAADESPLRTGSRRAWAVVAMTDVLPGLPLLVDFHVDDRLSGAFGSQAVQRLLKKTMDDLNIPREKLGLVASDNASYMTSALDALGCPRFADVAHVVNLIMKELLPDDSKPMQLVSKLSRFASRAGRERLENARRYDIKLARLKSCGTRWRTRGNVRVYILDLSIRQRLMAVLAADRGAAIVDEIRELMRDQTTWAEAVCFLDY